MIVERKLIKIKEGLVRFATLAESMLGKSIKGLKEKDKFLLTDVIEVDELRANEFEIELEEQCVAMIAQHQPAGKILRTILMISKITSTLERVGDHAVNICGHSLYLIERPQVKPLIDIPRMAETVMGMLDDSIHSFVEEDAALAKDVCERDSIVDGLRDQIIRELITFMTSDPTTIERSLHLIRIANNMERVADLSTNISEDVIYMVEGRVIKHHVDDENQE
ncbi:MAG: phosphate transport system regulatory protein PhoU [Deltaproteobacteria bacterium]|nr:MAG: phosphate transport system regulatory protein PhoU [Deltaproteobacteria bacterium]